MNTTRQPFDLAAALKGAKVVTRDGRRPLDLAHFPSLEGDMKIAVSLEGSFEQFTVDGHFFHDGSESSADLFLEVFTWPEGYEVHNPAGTSSPGEGYRFLSTLEVNEEWIPGAHYTGLGWGDNWKQQVHSGVKGAHAQGNCTIRVPQDHPFPPLPAPNLEFPPLPPGEEWHNPEGRDAEFFGVEYRPLTKREVEANESRDNPTEGTEGWAKTVWTKHVAGDVSTFTYRIPRSVPIPIPTPPPAPVWVPWTLETAPEGCVWVKPKTGPMVRRHISIWHHNFALVTGEGSCSYQRIFDQFTLLDGTPCGTKEEAQ